MYLTSCGNTADYTLCSSGGVQLQQEAKRAADMAIEPIGKTKLSSFYQWQELKLAERVPLPLASLVGQSDEAL